MMEIKEAYGFEDVLIVPKVSDVSSRDDVYISTSLSSTINIDFPLIASPMIGVVDGVFAHKLSELGGLAILHRFYPTRYDLFQDIEENLSFPDVYGISIKVGEEKFEEYFDKTKAKIILIDTANGYTKLLRDYVYKIASYVYKNKLDVSVMAGNVVTKDGCDALYNSGCKIIRVGIGGGSVCTTRNKTGISVPNISAIDNCMDINRKYKIVIDGGIKESGDLVKAFVAGADAGMSGKLFAECFEAPNDGNLFGMASRTHMEKMKVAIKSVEGMDVFIEKYHSLKDFITEFGYGIKSAATYLNAYTLQDIYNNGRFIKVSDAAIKKL